MQFQIGAILQHSNTPSLRVAGFEDEDDDEDEAPHVATDKTDAGRPSITNLQDDRIT